MGKDWFSDLTGFVETTYESTRMRLEVRDGRLHSLANERTYSVGRLETPSLMELRSRATDKVQRLRGTMRVSELTADVSQLLGDRSNAGALFQVASQFNLLEM